jgi:tetratricopeptide (TPR) repeat protein
MRKSILFGALLAALLCLLPAAASQAQDSVSLTTGSAATYPPSYQLNGAQHIWQGWNNCGPATLTMGLTYFGHGNDQYAAAAWLKPNGEDKNVSPWQMVQYVNSQTVGTTRATYRYGGTLDQIKTLVSNNFPVLIEAGYDPESDDQGWMGHYLLVIGYDETTGVLITHDSFLGANRNYTYDYIDTYWRHFHRVYIVLYDLPDEARMLELLGSDADERQNAINALEQARAEAIADNNDPFAWFNMGTSFVKLGMYQEAATAYDQARNLGLPWRMLWYQFGPFEAYYQIGRYQDMIALAQANLNDGGGQYVEETFYYAGLAREALGETERALDNFNSALYFNPNFTPAAQARARLQ